MVCVTSHRQEAENGLIWKRGYFYGLNKNYWVDFYHYKVVVYTHSQQTFMFKQLVKVNFATDDTFKRIYECWNVKIHFVILKDTDSIYIFQ